MSNTPSTPLFDKVLIANRGEIAVRIIKTLRKMGIKSVAVYSDADMNSLHTKLADEAYDIGPSPAPLSYLSIKKIMHAIRTSGAQAVHPGYGFLSENPQFAKALKRERVHLIGPSPKAIELMGDKIEAKKIAEAAGVSTVPGYMGIIKDAQEAVEIAKKIGFPIIIKAAAGGGGRGMRVIYEAEGVVEAFRSATNEAKNSFSDDRVFIEKFIENPRHIEIQVLADKFGNTLCLGERECSIQRHHQKVIEEAPSPFIDEETRQEMYRQVRSLAEKVGYYSAGTVEFIVDKDRNFYFLEMNTRLQVEHCVTELVTGIDLVEQMIRVAAGEKLTITQEDVQLNGWAIESRIYAEDPSRGFLPSSGRISKYQMPEQGNGIRVDSGVYEGGEVSMFYDPMIAKLCTYGETRQQAVEIMQYALGESLIEGISHNIGFLQAIMAHPRFMAGDISTNFIEEEYSKGFTGAIITSETSRILLSVAIHVYLTDARRAASTTGQLPGFERQIGNRWIVNIDDQQFPVITKPIEDGYHIRSSKTRIDVESEWILGTKLFRGFVDGKAVSVIVVQNPGGYYLTYGGRTVKASVRSPRIAELEQYLPINDEISFLTELNSPIAGSIVTLKVEVGEEVKPGQELVIIEAMKMENVICAEYPAKVSAIHVKGGDALTTGQLIMEFDQL
ncbi:acetyl-CoA carboxylase biotin carboxylase subunit [Rickettsiales endosymbiont of Stachyamoeba lipophora]|uniref:acetyl-CoA carboxylase biotin carboxylase subunit n=1 Tax=Rickettsiales endosymbiont of Stachyamoeba lipophora TaxID=2486578 RepID=UPI000F652B09|nr:acetyl/propionyl/methylcrotonyl-CoA carboxylase subunit alpha [Rickettsiales endosymbiont of Stachyamoeba lipophora]AZL15341.1 acetyl/propionyl/methylcrotonyl-CoA carboxylase subunit alpha [Rickettsiales endosymbiont of Stachyamoeba lipophora]